MSKLYLGKPAFSPKPFTRVDPAAMLDGGKWLARKNWSAEFPSEGKVFAPRLENFETGDLVCFEAEPNKLTTDRPDQFIVAPTSPQAVVEVLDLRSDGEDQARERIVEKGVRDLLRGSDRIVVALTDHTCVVPKMVRRTDRSGYVADQLGLEELPVFAFDRSVFNGDKIENRWIAVPRITVGREIRTTNWSANADFLETVLKRIKKVINPGGSLLTRAQIAQVVSLLNRADLLQGGGEDLKPVLRRLETFKPEFIERAQTVEKIAEILRKFDGVEDALHQDIEARRLELEAELRNEIAREISFELADLTRQIDEKRIENALLAERAASLKSDVQSEEIRVASAQSRIISELSSFLTEVSGFPSETEETMAALVAKLSALVHLEQKSLGLLSKPTPPWSAPHLSGGTKCDWSLLHEVLKGASLRSGYALVDYILADMAARAGEIVLLPEGRDSFVQSYSQAICGHDLVRHAFDPTTLGLDDLWSRPGTRAVTGFAKAWSAAKLQNGKFQVLLLDGLHRTPFDLWLPSLINVSKGGDRPKNLLVFCSVGSNFVDRERIWKGLATAVLPLAPDLQKDEAGRTLSEIIGPPSDGTSFAPSDAPKATEGDIIKQFDDIRKAQTEADSLKLLKYYSVGHSYGQAIDLQGYVAALAKSSARGDALAVAAVSRGAAWLSGILSDND